MKEWAPQDLTPLVEQSYDVDQYWDSYEELTRAHNRSRVGAVSVIAAFEPVEKAIAKKRAALLESDPVMLAESSAYISVSDLFEITKNGYRNLGSLNHGQDKPDRLLGSVLAMLNTQSGGFDKIITDPNKLIDYAANGNISNRLNNFLRGNSELSKSEIFSLKEMVASSVQESAMIRLTKANCKEEVDVAIALLEDSVEIRRKDKFSSDECQWEGAGYTKGHINNMIRGYDAQTWIVHGQAMLGELGGIDNTSAQLAGSFEKIQIESIVDFLGSQNNQKLDNQVLLSWFNIITENFMIYHNGLYGKRMIAKSMYYQDSASNGMPGDISTFEQKVTEIDDEGVHVGFLQPELIVASIAEEVAKAGHSDKYGPKVMATPITPLLIDFKYSKNTIGNIPQTGPTHSQRIKLNTEVRKNFNGVVQQIRETYESNEKPNGGLVGDLTKKTRSISAGLVSAA